MMVVPMFTQGYGLKLHTNAFSLEEFNLLVEALDKNFSIKASVNFLIEKNLSIVYIYPKIKCL
jgi:LAGLIDADG DNA endonuclease family